jgi:two-component system sensor histidine kinase TctE
MKCGTLERRFARTLRGRLLASLAVSLFTLLAISVVADYRTALGLANEAYDRALAGTAIALASRLERDEDDKKIELDLPPAAEAILRSDPEDTVLYAVIDEADRLVAGDETLAGLPRPLATAEPAVADGRIGDRPLRIVSYAYVSPTLRATVVVAETTLKRDRSAHGILSAIVRPNLLLIAATLALVFTVVRFALRPLDALGARIDARTPDDLSPVPDADVPGEARPLVAALNRLLANLDAAGRAQQAFLSNAAHQLRTPLAGMLMQLELALDQSPTDARPRLERLRASAQRLTRLTNQMLALARSSREAASARESMLRPLDLARLIEERASNFADMAVTQGIDLAFEPSAARVQGSDWMLRELIANLLDNALKFTPRGGHVTARCGVDAQGRTWLEVEDDGPGIPVADRLRVFERFQRVAGTDTEGSGLGLAIVREVAERHQASVTVAAGCSGGGTCIRVTFPAGG